MNVKRWSRSALKFCLFLFILERNFKFVFSPNNLADPGLISGLRRAASYCLLSRCSLQYWPPCLWWRCIHSRRRQRQAEQLRVCVYPWRPLLLSEQTNWNWIKQARSYCTIGVVPLHELPLVQKPTGTRTFCCNYAKSSRIHENHELGNYRFLCECNPLPLKSTDHEHFKCLLWITQRGLTFFFWPKEKKKKRKGAWSSLRRQEVIFLV